MYCTAMVFCRSAWGALTSGSGVCVGNDGQDVVVDIFPATIFYQRFFCLALLGFLKSVMP